MALPYGRRTIVGIEGIVKMSTDRYMKLILTVIAISLTMIAFRPFFAPTVAGAAGYEGCGLDAAHPCYRRRMGARRNYPGCQ